MSTDKPQTETNTMLGAVVFTLRLLISPFLLIGMLIFFCFAGIIFAPAGLLWIISVAWILCFKWLFIIIGAKAPEDFEQIEEMSYMIFLMMFISTVNFVKYGRLDI
jgi:hypothetical protein